MPVAKQSLSSINSAKPIVLIEGELGQPWPRDNHINYIFNEKGPEPDWLHLAEDLAERPAAARVGKARIASARVRVASVGRSPWGRRSRNPRGKAWPLQ